MAHLTVSLAKFTRNLVADVPSNQTHALAQIRQLAYIHTSWTKESDESTFAITRMLTQTLSNLVTGNETILERFWPLHIQLPEERSILIRLLGLPDPRTTMSVLVLLMNCVHSSSERGRVLISATMGVRICVSILDRLESLLDLPESGDDGKVFDLGYAFFSELIELGLFAELYDRTSLQEEVVSPSQTTLLKLLDSYLQSVPSGLMDDRLHGLVTFLTSVLLFQAEHAQHAIQQAIGATGPDVSRASDEQGDGGIAPQKADGAFDMQLPGICAALVLLSNCLSSIALSEGESEGGARAAPNLVSLTLPCRTAIAGARSSTGTGFVECLLETLRKLDLFLPRIGFGRAKPSNMRAPSGHGGALGQSADLTGFAYLKRDLVRLLGILCHDNRAVQDRVRLCEGIPIVLNLCVIDERNPYLREHALFALRNLLQGNPENQAVVDAIKPMGTWDADGVLRGTSGAVRR
ncbi:spinocerebellar ataxia type 10 protein domain-containing protein [Gloeopeniophorella convolvens]|nr:spinocerebellar ataxia type 10 protein domain-containing protein [Gloeopeniophorella convolvens]